MSKRKISDERGLQVDSGHAKEAALFTGCFRPQAEDQNEP